MSKNLVSVAIMHDKMCKIVRCWVSARLPLQKAEACTIKPPKQSF